MAITQRGTALYAADGVSGDQFGRSSAISGDGAVLVVGAPFRASGGMTESGGAYVYDYTGGAWAQRGAVLTAPTPEEFARYGYGVALSSDGTVLAVGAPDAVHGAYMGYVYIYDWSGTAWVLRGTVSGNTADNANYGSVLALSGDGLVLAVCDYWNAGFFIYDWVAGSGSWVQRGGLLTSPNFYSIGGDSVALSSDGAILAAGYTGYSYLATDRGAVVLFDYAGGVWTERASLAVVETGYVASDFFGSGASLSADGATLYAGAYGWDGVGSSSGKVYALNYSGGAWGAAGDFTPDDAATGDEFGNSVAVSANGLVVAVGASAWEGSGASNVGAVYVFDVSHDFVTAPTTLTVITAPSGPISAPTTLQVATAATVSGPTSLSVIAPSGAVSAPTALTVIATGSASAPSLLAMVAPAPAVPAVAGVPGVVWSARCLIDGVDVSARLVGQASVTAAEGAARIASITLRPAAGLVAPLDYVGKPITLDYVLLIGTTAVPRRIFTGRVDTPAYNPDSTLLTLTCTDDLQNVVAALPRSAVSHLVGGRFTEAVQGELDDEWDYAQARLTTVAGSLDASASGGLRTTLWELSGTWATFTESELIYRRMQLTLPQRSTLINTVEIGFDYRFMRLHQRQTTVGWSGTQPEMAKNGYQYPTQQDILGAADGTGWTVTQGIFYPAPAAIAVEIPAGSSLLSGFFYPPAGSIDMAVLHLAHRHSQTVTERYTITVTAGESVAVNGELPSTLRGALASDFSGGAWESALDVVPLMPGGGVLDYAPDADRDDADYAIQTLLDQARVKILSSHRVGRVGNAILCNPDLDLDKRVAIDTAQVSAAGKVALLVHVLDFESGSATTEFSLAISGVGGDGSSTPDVLAPPPPRLFVDHSLDWVYEIPPLSCHTYGVTPYDEGLMGLLLNPTEGILVEDIPYYGTINAANPFYVAGSYPVTGFRMQMPGVDDADRNPIDDPVAASYSIIVPTDTLAFTVP